jgi:hypothetical protein
MSIVDEWENHATGLSTVVNNKTVVDDDISEVFLPQHLIKLFTY